MVRSVAFLLFLATAVAAAPDALKVHRQAHKRLDRDARTFWKGFLARQAKAQGVFMRPYNEMIRAMNRGPGAVHDLVVDPSAYRALYAEYAALEQQRGEADLALARSGHPKALGTLFTALLGLAKQIEATEKELWERTGYGGWSFFDQKQAVRRAALAVRRRLLLEALASTPGAGAFLATEGMARAARKDGARSIERRVAVLDALGLTKDKTARPLLDSSLKSTATWERIAALEALMRFGADTTDVLAPLLRDPSAVVRRAFLDAVRARPDARWIPHVLRAYPGAKDLLRHVHVLVLRALTRQTFRDEPERWKAWYEKHRMEIEGGKLPPPDEAEKKPATKPKAKEPVAFYGAPLWSRHLIFVLDGSNNLLLPADWDVQKTRAYHDWTTGSRDWKGKHETHQAIMVIELGLTLAALPADARFGALMVKESGAFKTIGEKRLLRPTRTNVRKAVKFLEGHAPRGFRPELANLATAMEMAGLQPFGVPDLPSVRADTVVMIGSGSVQGGRFVVPEAALDAFRRMNRFRRLTVHTIRICNSGPGSEKFLKGLAEASGGTYSWCRKPR